MIKFNKNFIEIKSKIDLSDSDYIYSIPKKEYKHLDVVRINKFGFLNQFVDLVELFELKTGQDISYKTGFEELQTFQNYYEDFIDFILLLNYNLNFLTLNGEKDDNSNILTFLESALEKMQSIKSCFINDCLQYFTKLINDNKYNNDFETNPEDFHITVENKKKILIAAKEYYSKFEKLKNNIEEKVKLYPLSITSKILFPIVGVLYNYK